MQIARFLCCNRQIPPAPHEVICIAARASSVVRAASEGRGREFESRRVRHYAVHSQYWPCTIDTKSQHYRRYVATVVHRWR